MFTLNEIELNLNDIKDYTSSALLYLKNENKIKEEIDKGEIIMYLSACEEIINNIKNDLYRLEIDKYIDKKYLINYLYYLWDKIDPVYEKEVDKSISRMINELRGDKQYE